MANEWLDKQRDTDFSAEDGTLFYFDQENSTLLFKLYSSCTSEEISNDLGEGKGSAWTSEYIGKGNMEPSIKHTFTFPESQ